MLVGGMAGYLTLLPYFPMQWYLCYEPSTGKPRKHAFDFNPTTKEGLGLATRILRWCGDNFPGYPANRAEHLVSEMAGDGQYV